MYHLAATEAFNLRLLFEYIEEYQKAAFMTQNENKVDMFDRASWQRSLYVSSQVVIASYFVSFRAFSLVCDDGGTQINFQS
jgi:hypothetical protein